MTEKSNSMPEDLVQAVANASEEKDRWLAVRNEIWEAQITALEKAAVKL